MKGRTQRLFSVQNLVFLKNEQDYVRMESP